MGVCTCDIVVGEGVIGTGWEIYTVVICYDGIVGEGIGEAVVKVCAIGVCTCDIVVGEGVVGAGVEGYTTRVCTCDIIVGECVFGTGWEIYTVVICGDSIVREGIGVGARVEI